MLKPLWLYCYDVATHFKADTTLKGVTFFKRARDLAYSLELHSKDDLTDGLQSAYDWKQDRPGDALG